MTLKEANKNLEQLENEYNYWLQEKESLLSIVNPQSTDTTLERVDGGKRVDKMLKYVETEDILQIDNTLEYIHNKKINLMNWIDNELKILGKYEEVEQLIVYYKEVSPKKYTWHSISKMVHYSKEQCQRIYKRNKKKRDIYKDDTK